MGVMVGVPVKECAIWIERFFTVIEKFKGVSRFVFVHGEGNDPTLLMVREWAERSGLNVEIYSEMPMPTPLSSAEIAPVYWDFQKLMRDGDESHFLQIDSDIMKAPKNLVNLLKKQKKDIIAPYVWTEHSKPPAFYDTNIFRYNGFRFHPFDPPNPNETFRVDSVGTCFLATRKAFTESEFNNPYPHRRFCNDARSRDFRVWADPRIKIYHLNKAPLGITPLPLEILKGRPQDETPYVKKDEKVVPYRAITTDFINAYVWGRV